MACIVAAYASFKDLMDPQKRLFFSSISLYTFAASIYMSGKSASMYFKVAELPSSEDSTAHAIDVDAGLFTIDK